jgi:GT2 family glycosyltransferase
MTFTADSISIAIPTYNRDEVLIDTIRMLLQLDEPAREILVIDQTPQHAPDTERQLGEMHDGGRIRWIRRDRPSIPGAMNMALLEAAGEIVLFLDDDIIPGAGLVSSHAAAYQTRSADAVVGQILQPGQSPITHGRKGTDRMSDLDFAFNSVDGCFLSNVIAANLSVHRRRAIEIGGFDENFTTTAYRFETDFAWRLLDAHGAVWFEPSASIRHLKAGVGGVRSWGIHYRSISPAHSTGAYYFALSHMPAAGVARYAAWRLRKTVATRFDLTHPWWIPLKMAREVSAFFQAVRFKRRGRRLLENTAGILGS